MPESHVLPLVGKPEYEADIRLGLNAPSIENRWIIAPFMNRDYCSSYKQRRAAHRLETLHLAVLADRGTQPHRTVDALLQSIWWVTRFHASKQSANHQIRRWLHLPVDTGRHRDQTARTNRNRRRRTYRLVGQS